MKGSPIKPTRLSQGISTEASPLKSSPNRHGIPRNKMVSEFTTQVESALTTKRMSKTEKQIYSHDLIGKVMNKRFTNSVYHTVGNVDRDIQLYAKPQNPEKTIQYAKEFNPHDDKKAMYQSQYSRKIADINQRLNQNKSLSQRVIDKKDNSSSLLHKTKRPISANMHKNLQSNGSHLAVESNNNKKISVSGLVSYSFNSVNARKSLGFDLETDESKLSRIMDRIQAKNKCCVSRQTHLLHKRHEKKASKNREIKNAIFSDFSTKTAKFLTNLHGEVSNDEIVYGEKLSKLLCIKEFMEQEKIPYSDAEQIVNEIEEKKVVLAPVPKTIKEEVDEDFELNNRKMVAKFTPVILRHLTFVE